jgi:hypothetical protein
MTENEWNCLEGLTDWFYSLYDFFVVCMIAYSQKTEYGNVIVYYEYAIKRVTPLSVPINWRCALLHR